MKILKIILVLFFTQAVSHAQSAPPDFRKELSRSITDSQKLKIYKDVNGFYKENNIDTDKVYMEQALETFTANNYLPGKAAILSILSSVYSERGMSIAAQNAANDAILLFTQLKDDKGVAKTRVTLGVIEGRKGHYDIAVKQLLLGLQYYEKVSDTAGIVNSYVKLGAMNQYSGNLDKATDYYQKGLDLSLRCKPSANTAYLYINLASICGTKHEYDKAVKYLDKALVFSENQKYVGVKVLALMNMGNAYEDTHNNNKALDYYNRALKISEKTGMQDDNAYLLYHIGLVENSIQPGDTRSLFAALKIAKETGHKSIQVDILTALADIADTVGNYKQEVSYLKQVSIIRDSIFNIDKAKEIANLEAEYELKKSNEQLAALKISENKNLQKKNFIILIAVILTITLVTLTVFFIRVIKLNKKLSVREHDLQKANFIKDRLFSIIGHDLKGPIGNIPNLIHIHKHETTTEEEKKYILDSLEENTLASLETLEKLLSWGKLQLKGNILNKTVFNVDPIMHNKLRLFAIASAAKNITITNNVPSHLQLHADENHFKFVMRNLLSNAIKYTMHNGLIEINAEKQFSGNYIIFSVKDKGVGMDQDRLEHIFEPYNESTRGTANELGNSIGLMLCKEFILQNGGDIWVKSEKDKGATFYFTVLSAN